MSGTPREPFEAFVADARGRRVLVACAADAAGMAAAEIARRALDRQGLDVAGVLTPDKGELLVGRRLAERARGTGAGALLALDLGADDAAGLADGPTLFVDCHRHARRLASARLIEPARPAAARPAGVELWDVLRGGAAGEVGDSLWLAAMAAEAGHPKTDLPGGEPAEAGLKHSTLQEVAVLLNDAGRASEPCPRAALAQVAGAGSADEFLGRESAELERLRSARAEVVRETSTWVRTAPRFMWRVALVPVASPCRIEPILAAMWQRRLERYMVVVANTARAPGRVTVTARTATGDRNLLRLLDAATPDDLDEPIALGRRDYVEAVVPGATWVRMLKRMRFKDLKRLVPTASQPRLF